MNISSITTLRLGGPAKRFVEAHSNEELLDAIKEATANTEPILVVGGGSNLVVSDAGFDGVVIQIKTKNVHYEAYEAHEEYVSIVASAGVNWDDLVAETIGKKLSGLECLSGIPGTAGAAPIQNIGAYGASVCDYITRVKTWDTVDECEITLSRDECQFTYRDSIFKHNSRYIILEVEFKLKKAELSEPIRYQQLADYLQIKVEECAALGEVRDAVIALRKSKGMVLSNTDQDSVSAGSFFTNPILNDNQLSTFFERVRAELNNEVSPPSWPAGKGLTKLSAAWLIEQAGFKKGYTKGRVGLSSKHTLALINKGEATTQELIDLAREVQNKVEKVFSVTLQAEPVMVGVAL